MAAAPSVNAASDAPPPSRVPTQGRVTELVDLHVDSVWRTLRRLGMPPAELDDGVQQVFTVLARRIDGVQPGKERSFLLGVAVRVVSDHRRSRRRRPEDATLPYELEQRSSALLSPEGLLEERQRLELLDRLIGQLSHDLAEVFVLSELEELTMAEIARLLAIPTGTVASRLRRARERFESLCRDVEAMR
jgi:RNA polymerase sigma-70 factor, ECF subfamily